MDDSKRKRLKTAGAMTMAGALLLQHSNCAINPYDRLPSSDTTSWKLPETVPIDERQLLDNYKAAYQLFENVVDVALKEANEQKKKIGIGQMLSGLEFLFCAPGPSCKDGECYAIARSDPKTKIASFPAVIDMFSAYVDLCHIQNQIDSDLANRAGLTSAPDEKSFAKFVAGRLKSLPSDERVLATDSFVLDWFEEPVLAARNFAGARPVFKSEEGAASPSAKAVFDGIPWKYEEHTVTLLKIKKIPIVVAVKNPNYITPETVKTTSLP